MINENKQLSKSRALLEMKNCGYSLGEFKILDTYLSRIDPLDKTTAKVSFSKAEYCALMGIDSGKVRAKQLKAYTAHFLGNIVTLPRPDGKGGYFQRPLFTEADYDEDQELILLSCNPDPLVFDTFFNLKSIGYIQYILKNTIRFRSAYTFKLYMFILAKAPASEFEVGLPELRERMEIKAPRYDSFKFLNAEILKKSVDEINEFADVHVSYKKVQRKRLTVAVRFQVVRTGKQIMESAVPQKTRSVRLVHLPADFAKAFPANAYIEEGQAYTLAKLVYGKLLDVPELQKLSQEELELATACGLQTAYKRYIEPRYKSHYAEWPTNPGGYLYSILDRENPADYLAFQLFQPDSHLSIKPEWPDEQ